MGVGLVGQHPLRLATRPAGPVAPDRDLIEQRQQLRIVPGLTRRQNDRHREASPVDGQVDLAGQSAAGPSEGFSFNGEVLDP